jgi:hypothetical protein
MKDLENKKKEKKNRKEKSENGPRGNESARPDFWPTAHLPSPEPVPCFSPSPRRHVGPSCQPSSTTVRRPRRRPFPLWLLPSSIRFISCLNRCLAAAINTPHAPLHFPFHPSVDRAPRLPKLLAGVRSLRHCSTLIPACPRYLETPFLVYASPHVLPHLLMFSFIQIAQQILATVHSRSSPALRSSPAAPLWCFRTQASKPTKHTSPPSSSECRLHIPRRRRSPEARRRPILVPDLITGDGNPSPRWATPPDQFSSVWSRSRGPQHVTYSNRYSQIWSIQSP